MSPRSTTVECRTARSKAPPTSQVHRVALDDYWLINASASYKLQKGVEVFGRVENILNDHYEETYGYNTPGMAAFAGLKFTMGGPEGFGGGWVK